MQLIVDTPTPTKTEFEINLPHRYDDDIELTLHRVVLTGVKTSHLVEIGASTPYIDICSSLVSNVLHPDVPNLFQRLFFSDCIEKNNSYTWDLNGIAEPVELEYDSDDVPVLFFDINLYNRNREPLQLPEHTQATYVFKIK